MACGAPGRIHANRLSLALSEWGDRDRPPMLLLHSLAAHSHWWDGTAPRLAERFHVFALDFRGHGESDWADPPAYHFIDYVEDVIAVLDALGWESATVIGHSMGGYVGASLAAFHPERVTALSIVDMLTSWTDEQDRRARQYAERPGPRFTSRAEAGGRFRLTPPETNAPPLWLVHLGEMGVRERSQGVWEYAFDRQVFLHPAPDPWQMLPQIVAPTLVVRGSESVVMDRSAAQRVAAAVHRGEVVEIPAAYHHVMLDDPDAFAALVLRWLLTVSEGRPR